MDLGSLVDGANLMQTLIGIVKTIIGLLPWICTGVLVVVVLNPSGYGDRLLATLRGWLVSVGARVEQTNTRLDAIEASIRELKELVKK